MVDEDFSATTFSWQRFDEMERNAVVLPIGPYAEQAYVRHVRQRAIKLTIFLKN